MNAPKFNIRAKASPFRVHHRARARPTRSSFCFRVFPPFSERSRSLIASSSLLLFWFMNWRAQSKDRAKEKSQKKEGLVPVLDAAAFNAAGRQGLVNFKRSTRSRLCSSTSSSVCCCCCAGSRVFPFSSRRESSTTFGSESLSP